MPPTARHGLTLVEAVIASTFVALAALVALASLPALTFGSARARLRVEALHYAQSIVEEQRVADWPNLASLPLRRSLPKRSMPGSSILLQPTIEYSAVSGFSPAELLRIRVEVSWEERGQQAVVRHETTLANVPGR